MEDHLKARIDRLIPDVSAATRKSATFIRANASTERFRYITEQPLGVVSDLFELVKLRESLDRRCGRRPGWGFVDAALFFDVYLPGYRDEIPNIKADGPAPWMRLSHAAKAWDVSEKTLRRHTAEHGVLHRFSLRIGRMLLIRSEQLAARYPKRLSA